MNVLEVIFIGKGPKENIENKVLKVTRLSGFGKDPSKNVKLGLRMKLNLDHLG